MSEPNFYTPTDEEEREFWNAEGNLIFLVTANRASKNKILDVFEIEIEEYSGCVGGFNEGVGIEWGLMNGYLNVDRSEMLEGYTYYFDEITVSWTQGDGYFSDDDSDYYVGDIRSERLPLLQYLKLKLRNAWWFNIGWKIQEWRNA